MLDQEGFQDFLKTAKISSRSQRSFRVPGVYGTAGHWWRPPERSRTHLVWLQICEQLHAFDSLARKTCLDRQRGRVPNLKEL